MTAEKKVDCPSRHARIDMPGSPPPPSPPPPPPSPHPQSLTDATADSASSVPALASAPLVLGLAMTPTSAPTDTSPLTVKELDETAAKQVAAGEGLGRRVGGGMTWMTISTVVTRFATFVAQILMGWWLEPEDFALYGTATAVSGFLMVCRDMGTGYILVQRGRENYESNAGPAFWLGFTYNLVMCLVTMVVAYPLATQVYDARELAPMLIVMAAALPLGAVSNVLYSRLRLDLHFKAFSAVTTASGFLRQISMILLAWWGFGPMSFAWPVLIYNISDCLLLWWVTRDSPWRRPPGLSRWGSWVKDAIWLMITSLANFGMDWGAYLVLGPILGAKNPVIGYYFFAYQIAAQIGMILAFNSTVVLTPALQRLNEDIPRQCAAALRALRSLMLAGSVASFGLAAIMAPLEHLIWHGKYAESVWAIVIFGIFYPWRISLGLTTSLLTARGEYVRLAAISTLESLGLMAAAFIAGHYHPTAAGIAWWTGGWVLISRVGATLYIFARLQTSPLRVLRAMAPPWLICLGGLALALLLSHQLQLGESVARGLASMISGKWAQQVASRGADVAEILLYGSVCAGFMLVAARIFLRSALLDMIEIAPRRLQRALRLGLGLR